MKSKIKRFKFKMKSMKLGRHIFILIFTVTTISAYFLYDRGFKPVLFQLSEDKAKYLATRAINESILSTINEDNASYEDLVVLIKDDTGQIVGLITNIMAVNRLKSALSASINDNVSKIANSSVFVPIGSITGLEFLSSVGPRVEIGIIPSGSTKVDFRNEFISSGINQTIHRIILEVSTSVSIVMATKQKTGAEVTTSFPIAESIIVGRVPESFTNVESAPGEVRDDVMNLN